MPNKRRALTTREAKSKIGRTSLERRITAGRLNYIERIVYDAVEATIRIEFVKSPEDSKVDRILEFVGITDFDEEIDQEEADCLEALIGLDEYPSPDGTRYVVHTDMRELSFRTREQPTIRRVEQ